MFKIEKNVPLKDKRKSKYEFFLRKLEIGDSFVVDNEDFNRVYYSLRNTSNKIGFKICSREENENQKRIWRVE